MAGISDLNTLLRSMQPELRDGEYIYSVVKAEEAHQLKPIMIFTEEEGTTVVMKKKEADRLLIPYETSWKLITLSVHSDLQAVGLLATVCDRLASAGISVNAVSAFYHDHLFILPERADEAMKVIALLASEQ